MTEKVLGDYLGLPISEFWASQPKAGGVSAFAGGADPNARLVRDVAAALPPAPAPDYLTAADLCRMSDPAARMRYVIGTPYADPSVLAQLYRDELEGDKPVDQRLKFYPKW